MDNGHNIGKKISRQVLGVMETCCKVHPIYGNSAKYSYNMMRPNGTKITCSDY